jgi:hypothetical protein
MEVEDDFYFPLPLLLTPPPAHLPLPPSSDSVTSYRAVAQLRWSPSITGYTASCNSRSFRPSSGSEHHLHATDFPWTALFAATGGPSDIYVYFASPGSGSEHYHPNANYLWTDFIAASGGPWEIIDRINSAGYFQTAPSASMARGVCILDWPR